MTLPQVAEIKLKKYEGMNDDNPSVMQVNSVSQSDSIIIAIQGQGTQPVNQSDCDNT